VKPGLTTAGTAITKTTRIERERTTPMSDKSKYNKEEVTGRWVVGGILHERIVKIGKEEVRGRAITEASLRQERGLVLLSPLLPLRRAEVYRGIVTTGRQNTEIRRRCD
jgi:hypothetical protein